MLASSGGWRRRNRCPECKRRKERHRKQETTWSMHHCTSIESAVYSSYSSMSLWCLQTKGLVCCELYKLSWYRSLLELRLNYCEQPGGMHRHVLAKFVRLLLESCRSPHAGVLNSTDHICVRLVPIQRCDLSPSLSLLLSLPPSLSF